MKKSYYIYFILLVLGINVMIWYLIKPSGSKTIKKEKESLSTLIQYSTANYEERDFPIYSNAYWDLPFTSNLLFEVSGKLEPSAINWAIGQNFKANEIVCSLNAEAAYYNLTEKKQALIQDFGSVFAEIETKFPTEKDKWYSFLEKISPGTKIPSLPAFSSENERIFMSEAGLLSTYYAIKQLEINMKNYYFLAPYDGKIASINFQLGSYIGKNNIVAQLEKNTPPTLVVHVPNSLVEKYIKAAVVSVKLGNRNYGNANFQKQGFANEKTNGFTPLYYKMKLNKLPNTTNEYVAYLHEKEHVSGYIVPKNAVSGNKICLVKGEVLIHKTISIVKELGDSIFIHGLEKNDQYAIEFISGKREGIFAFKAEKQH